MTVEQALLAILPGLIKLIETAISDEYDQEREREALLDMNRALADERLRRALDGK